MVPLKVHYHAEGTSHGEATSWKVRHACLGGNFFRGGLVRGRAGRKLDASDPACTTGSPRKEREGGEMTKHRVRVMLVAECDVEIEVECDEGLEPTDLTKDEERRAIDNAEPLPRWRVDRTEEVTR
jgi:hypothetical protein